MRVIVTGGRARNDWWTVFEALNKQRETGPFMVVHGACPVGADHWASMWLAAHPECMEVKVPAAWERHDGTVDKGAGFARNAKMIAMGADIVYAFPHPEGSGTQHTVGLARKAGIKIIEL